MTSEKLESPLAEQLDPETVLATRYHITIPQTIYADFLGAQGIADPFDQYWKTPSRWSRLTWRFKSFYYRACDAWGVLTGKYEIKDDWS